MTLFQKPEDYGLGMQTRTQKKGIRQSADARKTPPWVIRHQKSRAKRDITSGTEFC